MSTMRAKSNSLKSSVAGSGEVSHSTDSSDTTLESLRHLETTLQTHSVKFDKVLQAILDTRTSLESRINAISIEVNLLHVDYRKLVGHVEEAEYILATMRPMVQDVHTRLQRIEEDMATLQRRAKDADGHSRCNNIH
ncbi:hypothetical protein NDU88_003285 [Pleurodeles waltl]|uniref:Uncharacterized protein n=1 Tax=Pleurodeles waltl TaxID=8319 RepID=A0AAV7MR78_PLEWA|nr:hypothetical protein NDU88_003285 [Pleurodeles waltl]